VVFFVSLSAVVCGGGAPPPAATANASNGASATVGVANSSLGSILVNSTGRTLYLFKADVGSKSACTGACAAAWPPLLTTGKPTAGSGLTASKLGTITRSGGNQQVTYNGHPLYLFIQDKKPGQTTGQGSTAFGAAWLALSPAGNQISATPPSSGGSASSGAGGY
jgi:predicted lipoprotein with Yx(FWY)xxD motif